MCYECGEELGTTTECLTCDCVRHRAPSIALSEWASIMCLEPFYFWQFGMDAYLNPTTKIPTNDGTPCNPIVYERCSSGSLVVGRQDIWRSLLDADLRAREYLGYNPDWRYGFDCQEISFRHGYHCGPIRLRWAKLKELGKENLTSLKTLTITNANITDDDGDGLVDTITITTPVVTGVTSDELALFFVEDDWLEDDVYRNELRPIKVKTSGTNWVITFASQMAVIPKLFKGMGQTYNDPSDLTLYAKSFNLVRRWADPDKAVVIMRKPHIHGCACGLSDDVSCYTCVKGTACIINAERSLIEIHLDGAKFCPFCADKIIIHYRSGDCGFPEIMANLAGARLAKEICCSQATPLLQWQQADYVGVDVKGKVTTTLTLLEKSNPFGTTRGAIDAFRFFRQRRIRKIARI